MKKRQTLILLFAIIMPSCSISTGWQHVSYDESLNNNSLGSACITNHQGEHELDKCDINLDDDTLTIHFPAQLPAYWGDVKVKIVDGQFNTLFEGIPFELIDLNFETIKQKLVLDRSQYLINDTLYGYCDFTFKEVEPTTGHTYTFYFKGTIREIVRDKDYNPLDPDNFMTFDLPTAIRELGQPLSRDEISTISEMDIDLLNLFSQDTIMYNVHIERLTWNISDDAQVSDGGIERLTIWYAQAKDKEYARESRYAIFPPVWNSIPTDSTRQLPVRFLKWNINIQF